MKKKGSTDFEHFFGVLDGLSGPSDGLNIRSAG